MSLNMLIEFGDAFDYTGADFREWCTEAAPDKGDGVTVNWCKHGDNSGPWEYRESEKQVYNRDAQMCLALTPESAKPILRPCDPNNSYHKWAWKEIKPYWAKN